MSSLKDLVRREYAIILDNFTNLVESFRIVDKHEEGRKVRVPGEMPDVFLEKMVQASHTLLNVTRELKRNAMLNDFESRNSQVDEEAARLRALIEERKVEIKALEALALPSI